MTTGRTGGVCNLYKPAGLTSHDLVEFARGILRERRVGHGGTLDPFAEGVLLVGFGSGTKILPYLSDLPKEYEAVIRLGEATRTLDPEGEITRRLPVPDMDEKFISRTMDFFSGDQEQMPPAYSAIKVGGIRAYALARQGVEVTLNPRAIRVEQISLIRWAHPLLTFRARVSKGTYLRTLASDLAERLGTCGHLVFLKRTSVGRHTAEDSCSLERLRSAAAEGRLAGVTLSLSEALGHLPCARLDGQGVRMIGNGIFPEGHVTVEAGLPPGMPVSAVGPDGRLVAILRKPAQDGDGPGRSFVIERVIRE